jgi:hypothetical protein
MHIVAPAPSHRLTMYKSANGGAPIIELDGGPVRISISPSGMINVGCHSTHVDVLRFIVEMHDKVFPPKEQIKDYILQ